jgi:hypothetical protein
MTSTRQEAGKPSKKAQKALDRRGQSTFVSRVTLLLALLIFLNLLVFADYYSGKAIPPWDFLGAYNTEAYYWWEMGGFFRPVDWIPSLWAGYPGALNLQNSAWYLPVGVAAFVAPYTLHSAAVLAALHTSAGFVGMFALLRSRGLAFSSSTVAATAWFFAPGFFANASHVDIARGYALLPLLLLVASSRWRWETWWGIAVAALVIWQVAIGVYPGIAIAAVYAGALWVITSQLQDMPRIVNYLVPLAIASSIAALLSAPRFATYIELGNSGASGFSETSVFDWSMVGALFFGFGSPDLPNDITMRSFVLPVLMLLLLPFAMWKSQSARLALSLLTPAIILGMPFWPWFALVQQLPGLGLSRFTMSDFKPFMLIAIIILAATALEKILSQAGQTERFRFTLLRMGGAVIILLMIGLSSTLKEYEADQWLGAIVVASLSLVALATIFLLPPFIPNILARTALLLSLVVLSGYVTVSTTPQTWNADRISAEMAVFGATVDSLREQQPALQDAVRRPSRLPLPEKPVAMDLYNNQYNRAHYSGELAVGGYLNAKGVETQALLAQTIIDKEVGPSFAQFLAAPGSIMRFDPSAEPSPQFRDCALQTGSDAGCGSSSISSVSYAPGRFVYEIVGTSSFTALANEAFYDGWAAVACDVSALDLCRDVPVGPSDFGVVQLELPAGHYKLHLEYRPPGSGWSWWSFWLGIAGIAVSVLWRFLPFSKKRASQQQGSQRGTS